MIIKGRLSTERTDKNIRVLFFFFPWDLIIPGNQEVIDFVYVPCFYLTYILNYNPGQNSWNNKDVAPQIEASFLPFPPVQCWRYAIKFLIQHKPDFRPKNAIIHTRFQT